MFERMTAKPTWLLALIVIVMAMTRVDGAAVDVSCTCPATGASKGEYPPDSNGMPLLGHKFPPFDNNPSDGDDGHFNKTRKLGQIIALLVSPFNQPWYNPDNPIIVIGHINVTRATRPPTNAPTNAPTPKPTRETRAPFSDTPRPTRQTKAPFNDGQTHSPSKETPRPTGQTKAPFTDGQTHSPSKETPRPTGQTKAPFTDGQTHSPSKETPRPTGQTKAPFTDARTRSPSKETPKPTRETLKPSSSPTPETPKPTSTRRTLRPTTASPTRETPKPTTLSRGRMLEEDANDDLEEHDRKLNVFLPDDRITVDVTQYPNRAVGRWRGCTASLVYDSGIVVTNAHCLNYLNNGDMDPAMWTTYFYAGFKNGVFLRASTPKAIWYDKDADYAVLKLWDNIDKYVGRLGVWWRDISYFNTNRPLYMNSYSGDHCGSWYSCVQKRSVGSSKGLDGASLKHNLDATRGSSGSAMYWYYGGVPVMDALNWGEYRNGGDVSLTFNSYTGDNPNVAKPAGEWQAGYNKVRWF